MSGLVSIIIPIYNLENYIEYCLNSVVNQTYKELEILCIDDGSTDKSAEIIKRFAASDSRIKYFYQDNAGVSAARNKGLDEATGEYVMFVDGDDYLHLRTIERFISEAELSFADIICGELNVVYNSVEDTEVDMAESECIVIQPEYMYSASQCGYRVIGNMFKRSLIGSKRFIVGLANGEDSCLMLEMILDMNKAVAVRDKYYFYLIRNDSASHNAEYSMKLASLIDSADITCDMIKEASDLRFSFLKIKFVKGLYITIFINRVDSAETKYGKEVKKKGKAIGKKQLRFLFSLKGMPLYEKIAIYIAFKIPFMYKVFRIMTDRTMLNQFFKRPNR